MKLVITDDLNSQKESEEVKVISPNKGDNIYDLDTYVDHNECADISFNLIDYVSTGKLPAYINALANKLAHGGKLTIVGTDALQVTQAFKNGQIDTIVFNELVYGKRDKVWAFKQSLVSLHDVVAIMKLNKLKVTQKRLSDFTYSVVGERE